MITLSQDILYDFFTVSDTGHDGIPRNRPFTFVNNKSDKLVVTIGDSWTWGRNLTENEEERVSLIYGRLVSDAIKADWLNLGQIGSGNFWLSKKVKELSKLIPGLHYEHIYVICTFTEVGRAFNSDLDRHINYVEWFDDNTNYYDLLRLLNNSVIDEITKYLDNFSHITLKIGTNFVEPIGFENLDKTILLSKSWLNVCLPDMSESECFLVSSFVVDALREAKTFCNVGINFDKWIHELIDAALIRQKLLGDRTKFKYGHPLKLQHECWAEYIIKHL